MLIKINYLHVVHTLKYTYVLKLGNKLKKSVL